MIREAKSTSFKGEKECMKFFDVSIIINYPVNQLIISCFPHAYVCFKNSAKFDQCRVQILEFLMLTQSEDYPIILFDTVIALSYVTSFYFIFLFLMHQKSHNHSTYLVIILIFGYSGSHCLASLLRSIFQISCFDKNIVKFEI